MICLKYHSTKSDIESSQIADVDKMCWSFNMTLLEIRNAFVNSILNDFKTQFSNSLKEKLPFILNLRKDGDDSWYSGNTLFNNLNILTNNNEKLPIDEQTYSFSNQNFPYNYAKFIKKETQIRLKGANAYYKLWFLCSDGKVVQLNFTWYEAINHCSMQNKDLYVINNDLKNLDVPDGQYWINLYRQYWTWKSSKSLIYSNWADNNPQPSQPSWAFDLVVADWEDLKWSNENRSQAYVICMNGSVTDSPTLVDANINFSDGNSPPNKPAVIGMAVGISVGVGGMVLIVFVVIFSVLCVRKGRKHLPGSNGITTNSINNTNTDDDAGSNAYYARPMRESERSGDYHTYDEVNEAATAYYSNHHPEYAEVVPSGHQTKSIYPNSNAKMKYVEIASNLPSASKNKADYYNFLENPTETSTDLPTDIPTGIPTGIPTDNTLKRTEKYEVMPGLMYSTVKR
ncbi:hypothetical protein HELRODRAFT_177337 [Helobdella robusta]|uniref:C-type lectin domain-containing protein n=1 Tax=Helobdella robusta TaxID=6412 RepID=T1FBJ0_HELRO|nr:hypothetical protein HELRODRAFT_177337 [Helobdella robusta]ESN98100.1 hypothetical protein HELRODRAFT_177337 [Helobdella robusta]